MDRPDSPLAPLTPDPGRRRRKRERSARSTMHRLLVPMVLATIVAARIGSGPLLVLGAVIWAGWIVYYVLLTQVLDPSGRSTPAVNQHSNIAAMAARGETAKAVEAYRAAIVADPRDVVACDHLGRLALRELKDYGLAVQAYREAERRETKPERRRGYAMLILTVYREYLRDAGRATAETRRILADYPDAPNAAALRAELREMQRQRPREP